MLKLNLKFNETKVKTGIFEIKKKTEVKIEFKTKMNVKSFESS